MPRTGNLHQGFAGGDVWINLFLRVHGGENGRLELAALPMGAIYLIVTM